MASCLSADARRWLVAATLAVASLALAAVALAAPKVVVISLDGATPRFVEQFLDKGVLDDDEGQHPGEDCDFQLTPLTLTRDIEMLDLDGTPFTQARTVTRSSNWPSNIEGQPGGPPRPCVIGIQRWVGSCTSAVMSSPISSPAASGRGTIRGSGRTTPRWPSRTAALPW
jgi:hypothetical protein